MRKFWEKPICGIYKITHRESGKCYIGQSVDVFKRWQGHSNLAVKKKSAIQNAFVLYGIDKFSFEVVEECEREMLNDREVHWIAYFGSFGQGGYNLTSGGGQAYIFSEETKEKQSAAKKGKKLSEEHIAKRSASQTGKKRSEETKAKMSASGKGKEKSEEAKAKMRVAKRIIQVECPHCSKTGALNLMKRYHFENCKIYKELGVPKLGEETAPDTRSLNALLFPK
jgi:group I intron endonuclease